MTLLDPAVADRFHRPPGTYLLSHSIGLPLVDLRAAAVADHFEAWERDAPGAWPVWLDGIEAFRRSLAGLIGARPSEVCPQTNLSSSLTKVLGALPRPDDGRRPVVLLSEDAFPSMGFVCQRSGAEVRFVPRSADVQDVAVWDEHLDGVDVVLLTHVHSNTGEVAPVRAVAERARTRDAVVIVDVAQSVGILEIDVAVWNADVVLGSCVKWLGGGPGAGWCWIHPDLLPRLLPVDVGWWSHEEPFAFDIHDYRDAGDARRLWGGTPSVLPFQIARRAIDHTQSLGVAAVREHNLVLTQRLIDALPQLVASPTAPARRSGTVIVDAGERTDDLVARLAAAQVHVDRRSTGIRLSPHVFTTGDDIARVIHLLRP